MKLKLCILILLAGCASTTKDKSIKTEINDGDVSVQSVLDLSRSSYLKGCVEGIKYITKKESKGMFFNFCKTKAILHEKEIESILK